MSQIINIQDLAAGVYLTVLTLNQNALNLIGLESLWCRLLPYQNGEDVIVLEYTLHSYECPKQLKVVTSKTDYSLGNFSIDMFGIHQEVPLEINIDTATWESVYGKNTMPLKGDFVYIQMLHRPFEVISSANVYTLTNMVTSFKCQLGEWKHSASRKEPDDFKFSIDELTDSQDRLFGDNISKEVADAVVEVETSYQETTYVDPIKEFDIDSVVTGDIPGPFGHIIAPAWYDFSIAKQEVQYKVPMEYDTAAKENYIIFTCWFSIPDVNNVIDNMKFKGLQRKEKDFWYFEIETSLTLQQGSMVTVYRGGSAKLNGYVEWLECGGGTILKIPTADCLRQQKKLNNFWQGGVWKIQQATQYHLFSTDSSSAGFSVSLLGNNLIVTVGEQKKTVQIVKTTPQLSFEDWHYLMFEVSPLAIRVVLVKDVANKSLGTYQEKQLVDETIPMTVQPFTVSGFKAGKAEQNLKMTHIRLYESEYEAGETYKQDMYADVTRNASKLILVDSPRPANKMSFISPVR